MSQPKITALVAELAGGKTRGDGNGSAATIILLNLSTATKAVKAFEGLRYGASDVPTRWDQFDPDDASGVAAFCSRHGLSQCTHIVVFADASSSASAGLLQLLTSPFALTFHLPSTQVFVVCDDPTVLGPNQGVAAYVRGANQTDASKAAMVFRMLEVQADPEVLMEADLENLLPLPDAADLPATIITAHWFRRSQTLQFESLEDQIALLQAVSAWMVPFMQDISLKEVVAICKAVRDASAVTLNVGISVSLNTGADLLANSGVGRVGLLCTGGARFSSCSLGRR